MQVQLAQELKLLRLHDQAVGPVEIERLHQLDHPQVRLADFAEGLEHVGLRTVCGLLEVILLVPEHKLEQL